VGCGETGLLKRDEEGDEDGDNDERDHRVDSSPGGTLVPPRERGTESPPYASSSMASP